MRLKRTIATSLLDDREVEFYEWIEDESDRQRVVRRVLDQAAWPMPVAPMAMRSPSDDPAPTAQI